MSDTLKKISAFWISNDAYGNNAHYQSYTATIMVNGQRLFYACEGIGRPIVLLHGNGGSHNDLETTTRQLAQAGYRVYALDSRGQGANAPLSEYHYRDMAEDTYQFIRTKGLYKPAVFGWSDGGIVALELESYHPGTCSMLVTSGANITVENCLSAETFHNIFGDPDSYRPPLTQMMYLEPHLTRDDMQRIMCPALICGGEHDLILEHHTRMIADYIPNGEAMIIHGADHGSHIWHNTQMGEIILRYFRKHGYVD